MLISDCTQVEIGKKVLNILHTLFIKAWQSEPEHQNQNPAERRYQNVKSTTNTMMDRTGTPACCWLLALMYVAMQLNVLLTESLNGETPTYITTGKCPNISPFLCFMWYEPVYYKIYEDTFLSDTREACSRFVGVSKLTGHAMTFKVLSNTPKKF